MKRPNDILVQAIRRKDVSKACSALEAGAEVNWRIPTKDVPFNQTPLMLAAGSGSVEMVKLLLGHGASLKAVDKHYLRTDGGGATALHYAVRGKHHEVMKVLLEAKADPNKMTHDGHTPLCIASFDGDEQAVKLLLKNGAGLHVRDGYGCSVAHLAIQSGNLNLLRFFLNEGINVNDRATSLFESTLLRQAVCEEKRRMVLELLKRGADPNIPDHGGAGALAMAVKVRSLDLVKELLQHGANINQVDKRKRTPLDWAEEWANDKQLKVIKDYLLQTGAKRASQL